jgi:uncharacterized membrane protein YcaP (DUF421 family)
MFQFEVAPLQTVARTLIVYTAVLVGLRLTGKREVGQMTPFDLVVILLIANAVQNAMVGSDNSLVGGLLATAVLLVANYLVVIARERIPWLRRVVEGSPTLLIHDGHLLAVALRRENVDADEVLMAMREHGIDDIASVRSAVLETDGSISIVPQGDRNVIQTRRRVRQRHRG